MPWQHTWKAAAPLISTPALKALRRAMEDDDYRLIQGRTTSPSALLEHHRKPCDGACLLGFCGMADGLKTVGEIEQYFTSLVARIDKALGEPAGVRWLLNWYDETPREEVFGHLLAAVCEELKVRAA